MASKHKIISLTSLIIGTVGFGSLASAEITNHIVPLLADTHAFYKGQHGESGEGEGGQHGESGEGGFNAHDLKTNNIQFHTALETIKAHYFIGEKLYEAGDYDKAEAFFGHPISEVLSQLSTALEHRKIESFEDDMYALLEIAQTENNVLKLKNGIQTVFTKIEKAHHSVKNQFNIPNIAAVNSDLLVRSKIELYQAFQKSDISKLQDAIGYFDAAYALFNQSKDKYKHVSTSNAQQLEAVFTELKPYYLNFKAVDKNLDAKKMAGYVARAELLFNGFRSE